jgi:hypothetical protein
MDAMMRIAVAGKPKTLQDSYPDYFGVGYRDYELCRIIFSPSLSLRDYSSLHLPDSLSLPNLFAVTHGVETAPSWITLELGEAAPVHRL